MNRTQRKWYNMGYRARRKRNYFVGWGVGYKAGQNATFKLWGIPRWLQWLVVKFMTEIEEVS